MKFLDKLKNALFEEEYVEVEEKPKKKNFKKESKILKKIGSDESDEKPIAKKIVLPEKNEVKVTNHIDSVREDQEKIEKIDEDLVEERSFPMVSDNEFITHDDGLEAYREVIEEVTKDSFEDNNSYQKYDIPEKNVQSVDSYDSYKNDYQYARQEQYYDEPKHHAKLYGIEEEFIPEPEYGTYEKKEEKTYFKPSPIISPIYGILDKNYKKEEIVSKREVKLTSNYSKGSLDLDEVRKKAYGTVSNEIDDGFAKASEDDSNLMDQNLLDLSTDDKPEIKKVTLEDAEEYFNDLGLEYNVDYKDGQKEKKEKQKVKITHADEDTMEESAQQVTTKEDSKKEDNNKALESLPIEKSEDMEDDDNLFDLIDSMYEKE